MLIIQNLTKLYYSIGEVADMLSVNTSLIRYWEKEFKIINPKKNKKGNRMFTPKDIEDLQLIYHLTKERGFTLEGAKKKLKENKAETIKTAELISKLKHVKNELEKIKNQLEK